MASLKKVSWAVAVIVAITVSLVAGTVVPVSATTRPDAPTNLVATMTPNGLAVELKWDAPTNVAVLGHNITRNGRHYKSVIGSEFLDTEVEASNRYIYAVSAWAGPPADREYGPQSESISITVPDLTDPSGDEGGPGIPTGLTAVARDAADGGGIRVAWSEGRGSVPTIGYNINRNGQFLGSLVGSSSFLDTEVEAGVAYTYSASAWGEGPLYSQTSAEVTATARATPPPGTPGGLPGPPPPSATDPLFDDNPRIETAAPPLPQQVRIEDGRLLWEMPKGPRWLFQLTRNSTGESEDERLWARKQVTPGHPELQYSPITGERVLFSYPVDERFKPGDHFLVEAIHPYEFTDVANNVRSSNGSRVATIPPRPGSGGAEIGDFLSAFGTDTSPSDPWIGSRSDWQDVPQFADDFEGSGQLVDRTTSPSGSWLDDPDHAGVAGPGWYFARNDTAADSLTPAFTRDQTQSDRQAELRDGKLEMSVDLADGSYPYIGTASNAGDGYLIDPSNGVFVEASVRLDQSAPADNAWWSFWLMAPGGDHCVDGKMVRGGRNPYDGHPATGTEVDIFELVPDANNGFNQAVFRWEDGHAPGCVDPGDDRIGPGGRNFSFWAGSPVPEVDVPRYMDGNYHRIGLYYAPDCYAFYVDNELVWHVSESDRPGWITPTKSESIRMTWELQNPRQVDGQQIASPWTGHGGSTKTAARTTDPNVLIDFVKVWEKKPEATGHCAGADPATPPDYYEGSVRPPVVLEAPLNVQAAPDGDDIAITWGPGNGQAADGWDISRDGEGYWTVNGRRFVDPHTTAGQTYTYAVTPWVGAEGADRRYGPSSAPVTVTAGSAPDDPTDPDDPSGGDPSLPAIENVRTSLGNESIRLSWDPTASEGMPEPDGYRVVRRGSSPIAEEFVERGSFIDNDNLRAKILYTYDISAYVGPPEDRRFGPSTSVVVKNLSTVAPPEVNNFRIDERFGNVYLQWDHPSEAGDYLRGSAVSGYHVLRDGLEIDVVDDTRPGAGPLTQGGLSRSYADRYVDREETYIYTLVPFQGEAGDGLNGPPSVAVAGPPLAEVGGLAVRQARFAAELVVTWSPPPNGPQPSGYNIERNGQFIDSVASPTYIDPSVLVAGTYTYTVVPYWNVGASILGPRSSTAEITVGAVPDAIIPESPIDIRAEQLTRNGRHHNVEVTWTAPPGWDKGLIDSYDVFRNGSLIGTLYEPDFGTQLPTSERTFLDRTAPASVASAYKVRARSLRPGNETSLVGRWSGVAAITPAPEAVSKKIPESFVRAVETVIGVTGLDAERLGGELFTIDRLNQDHLGRDYKPLIRSFNNSLAEFGRRELMIPAATLNSSSSAEAGELVMRSVAARAGTTDLLSAVPGYEPAGFRGLKSFGFPLSDETVTERAERVRSSGEELEAALGRVNQNRPSRGQLADVERWANDVVFASLGVDTVDGRRVSSLSSIIRNGYHPTRQKPIANCGGRDDDTHGDCLRTVSAATVASNLFNGATVAERAEFFGLEPHAFEFAQSFQSIADNSYDMRRRIKNAKIRRWLGVLVGVVFSIASLNPQLGFWAAMAVAAGGAYVSTVVATGSTAAAEKQAINSMFTSALSHYGGIANLRGWGILVEGGLHAAYAEFNDQDPEEAFLAAVADRFLQGQLADSEWLKVRPHLSAIIGMVLEAVISGDVRDWDDFVDRFEDQFYDEVGGRIGAFVGAELPASWGSVGDALADLVGHGIVSESRIAAGVDSEQMRSELRQHFYDETLPVLAKATGTALTGDDPEAFFASILGDIGEMIVLSIDPEYGLETVFERFVYAQAGRFAQDKVEELLVEANRGQSNQMTTALSEAVGVAITYSYDEDERQLQLEGLVLDNVNAALVGLLPPSCDSDRIAELSGSLLDTLTNSESSEEFEANAELLVSDGILLGTAISESCGEPDPDDPSDPDDPTDPDCQTEVSAAAGLRSSVLAPDPDSDPSCPSPPTDVERFREWLFELSPEEIQAETQFSTAEFDPSKKIITATKPEFADFRVVVSFVTNGLSVGQVQRFNRLLPNSQWQFVGDPPVGVVVSGARIADLYDPNFSELKERLLALSPSEIDLLLTISTIAQRGQVFDLVSTPTQPRQRLKISGGLGVIEIRSGSSTWTPSSDLVVVRRGAGGIVKFEDATDNRLEDLGDAMGRLVLASLDITNSLEEWRLIWAQVKGCGVSIRETLGDIWELISGPFEALKNLLRAVPVVWAALNYNARLFMEEALLRYLRDDVRLELAAQGAAGEARWRGMVKCDLLLMLIRPTAVLRALTPGAGGEIVDRANSGEFNDFPRRITPCNSFPAETLVLMADGSHRAISDIRPGDQVIAANEATGVWSSRPVLDQWSHVDHGRMATVRLVDGSQVSATDHHQFWVASDGAWVELEDVRAGDFLLTPDGVTEVASVGISSQQETLVWELDVAVDDTFAVHTGTVDVLVHNASCDIDAVSYFPARVDTRYAGPAEGRSEFRVSARRLDDNSTWYEVSGRVLKKESDRSGFENANYPTNEYLDLPSNYHKSHLVGPGGFGQESGQILYATGNFNQSFMTIVENRMQDGFAIAEANGWKMMFVIQARSYPSSVHAGAVLKQIDYEAWFEKPGVTGRFLYLDAAGGQTAPTNGRPGSTNLNDVDVYSDFTTPSPD